MQLSNKQKILCSIGLFVFGIYPLYQGITDIMDKSEKVNPIDISKLAISTTPYVLDKPYFIPPENLISDGSSQPPKLHYVSIDFRTNDTFAVGNPVLVNITAEAKPNSNVTGIYVTFVSPQHDPRMNSQNLNYYIQTHINKDLLPLTPSINDKLQFNRNIPIIFTTEQSVTVFILIFTNDNYVEQLFLKDSIITINPYTEKLQADANRLAIVQIPQTQKATDTQLRSNQVIEGLSWLIIAWIPFELITRIWKG